MTNNNFLPLDLRESLFFETGYEIDDLVSISLDPDISIQTFSDYVSIRGVISLEGEYIKLTDWPEGIEQSDDDTVEHIHRSVAKISEEDDERVIFYHHFPIEISVPLERISKIDDVTVNVEAFDYTLHQGREMKVIATLHINGIKHEQSASSTNETKESRADVGDTFQFEVVPMPEQEKGQTKSNEAKPTVELDDVQAKELEEKQHEERPKGEHVKLTEDITDEEDTKETKVHDIKEFKQTSKRKDEAKVQQRKVEDSEHVKIEERETHKKERESEVIDELEDEIDIMPETDDTLREPIQILEQVDLDEEAESSKEALEDIFYLTDLFAEEEIEERNYRMKLRIVQEDESLGDIADQYDVSTQKIMSYNNLDGEILTKGQLLYIPIVKED